MSYINSFSLIVLLPKFLGRIILFLLFPNSVNVDCYLVRFVIFSGKLIFVGLHLKASCMAWDEVLSQQICSQFASAVNTLT